MWDDICYITDGQRVILRLDLCYFPLSSHLHM